MLRLSALIVLFSVSQAMAGVAMGPSIGLVDNGDGTITLQVTAAAGGSTAVELDVVFSGGLSIDGVGSLAGGADVVIGDPIYDTATPGNNPFTGGVTFGISPDNANDRLFVSYGSDVFTSTSPVDLLTIDYDGTSGMVNAGDNANIVAQFGVNNSVMPVSLSISGGPIPGDANNDGMVDLFDLDVLGANFGLMGGATFAQGDFTGDGNVDLADLDVLGGNFGFGTSTAIPEPSAALLGALALVGLARPRG